MAPLALRSGTAITPSLVGKLEKYVGGLQKKVEHKGAALDSFTGRLFHDSVGGVAAYMTGAYYGRTDGFRLGPVDAGLLVGGLGMAYGLFGDGEWAGHAGTVGRSVLYGYLTLSGFQQGKKWLAEVAANPSSPTHASGNDAVRGRAGRTLDPSQMQAVASRLA